MTDIGIYHQAQLLFIGGITCFLQPELRSIINEAFTIYTKSKSLKLDYQYIKAAS
jgi:hypothetical protein